jgi:hypothetical protein
MVIRCSVRQLMLLAGLATGLQFIGAFPMSAMASEPPGNPASPRSVAPVASEGGAKTAAEAGIPDLPSYRPPSRSAPAGRIGGGTRGIAPPQVFAIAPDHVGLTTRKQPVLYWYLAKPAVTHFALFSVSDQGTKTLFEETSAAPVEAGMHKLDLARHGIRLQPNVAYRWVVTIGMDAKPQSSSAGIQWIAASPEFAKRLASAPKTRHAALYAEEGIWYDAMASIGELIEQFPDDRALRAQRAALLEQADLGQVAAGDRPR